MGDDKEVFEQSVGKLRTLRVRMLESNVDVMNAPEEVASNHRAWLKAAFKSGRALKLTTKEIIRTILLEPAGA